MRVLIVTLLAFSYLFAIGSSQRRREIETLTLRRRQINSANNHVCLRKYVFKYCMECYDRPTCATLTVKNCKEKICENNCFCRARQLWHRLGVCEALYTCYYPPE